MAQPKITIDLKRAEALAARGLTLEQIAVSLGIGVRTLSRHKRQEADLAEAIKRGREKGIATVANKLFESAMDGNTAAMIFFLKARGGWSEKIDISSTVTQPQTVTIDNDLKE